MTRQWSTAISLGTVLFLSSSAAHAQLGGFSLQLGGNGYATPYPNYGYNGYRSYYPNYGYNNNGYYYNGYSNNGYYNNGYYNNGYYNNLNGGYIYRSPNYYVVPQRVYPLRRIFRW